MVKGSHQQASYDMLVASRAVLDHMKVGNSKLFLAGWSQGGFVTMAFLEKLEGAGVTVQAAATASAPVDVFVALNGFLNFPGRTTRRGWRRCSSCRLSRSRSITESRVSPDPSSMTNITKCRAGLMNGSRSIRPTSRRTCTS